MKLVCVWMSPHILGYFSIAVDSRLSEKDTDCTFSNAYTKRQIMQHFQTIEIRHKVILDCFEWNDHLIIHALYPYDVYIND